MKLIKSKNHNINYLAKIVKIDEFKAHRDPEVNKLKCCTVDGFNIICGIESEPGLYVYFPTACCLNPDFLRYANLYRHKELNNDPDKSGMFEDNGRVKAIRLRGELSEGFILPIVILENYIQSVTNQSIEIEENVEFDAVEHDGKSFWINKKYIPKNVLRQREHTKGNHSRQPKGIDRIIENQFRFHYDTILIKKCPYAIQPDDIIHISSKIHGTSGISARVLCKIPRAIPARIACWIAKYIFRCNLTGDVNNNIDYDYIYSSRTVIKNRYYNKKVSDGFYGVDVWKYADEIVKPHLQKGMTFYYEIVGFLPNGGYIQKGYDYGCEPPKEGEKYTHEKHFKVRIYRITLTNPDGYVHEFSTQEVKQYCGSVGLTPVEEYYYGRAADLYPEITNSDFKWSEEFLNKLSNDAGFNMELNSPECINKVPHEGVVIKIENGRSAAFKLKCFKFLNKEQESLDKGEISIEDEA
jgi:hypothetical protein